MLPRILFLLLLLSRQSDLASFKRISAPHFQPFILNFANIRR